MKVKLVALCLILFLAGCTTPTQRIASQALQRGIDHSHSLFYDMSRMARQEILNHGADRVAKAAFERDAPGAQVVLKDVFDKMNDVDWLHVQWERGRSLMRIGQQYVWSRRGVLNVLREEWKEASKRTDEDSKRTEEAPSE